MLHLLVSLEVVLREQREEVGIIANGVFDVVEEILVLDVFGFLDEFGGVLSVDVVLLLLKLLADVDVFFCQHHLYEEAPFIAKIYYDRFCAKCKLFYLQNCTVGRFFLLFLAKAMFSTRDDFQTKQDCMPLR